MKDFFKFDSRLMKLAEQAEAQCFARFAEIDQIACYNSEKVLKAFVDHRVSEAHFMETTGYGYDDRGRDTLDRLFAQVFGAEAALVRHNFVSGTHALTVALFGVLRPGESMVSLTGKPYDTLEEVIGLRGNGNGSLKDFGIQFQQVDLLDDGSVNLSAVSQATKGAKVVYIQRSRGYSLRPALTVNQIEDLVRISKQSNPNAFVIVDNCYGEFVEKREPLECGADLIVGSLIKNAGGGLAKTGGYIAGRKELVELCSFRLTSPGMGREVGCTLGQNRSMFMGLYFAPVVTASALKTAAFACSFFELLGFSALPRPHEQIGDIISALQLNQREALISFCKGLQQGSPVDSFVSPQPWDMPGYHSQVIMAAGAFTAGASIELSADAPLEPPYTVYLQGGLTYPSGKIGVMSAAQRMLQEGHLSLSSI